MENKSVTWRDSTGMGLHMLHNYMTHVHQGGDRGWINQHGVKGRRLARLDGFYTLRAALNYGGESPTIMKSREY